MKSISSAQVVMKSFKAYVGRFIFIFANCNCHFTFTFLLHTIDIIFYLNTNVISSYDVISVNRHQPVCLIKIKTSYNKKSMVLWTN